MKALAKRRIFRLIVQACLGIFASSNALADVAVQFESVTYESAFAIFRAPAAKKVVISGQLRIPSEPAGAPDSKRPAAIILHTCSGPGSADSAIVGRLTKMGIASLQIDSLGPRGWTLGACEGRFPGNEDSQVADAFAGLRFLAARPELDPSRIVVIGSSMGGGSANQAAADILAKRLMVPDGLRFAAHVSFFPNVRYAVSAAGLTGAPMLFLLGSQDNWTPPTRVKAFVDHWKKDRPALDLKVVEYRTGHNWFSERESYSANNTVQFDCPVMIVRGSADITFLNLDGSLRSLPEGAGPEQIRAVMAEDARKCVKRGAGTTPNPVVVSQSLADMESFLREILKLPQ